MARNSFGGDLVAWVLQRNDSLLPNLVQLAPGVVVTFWSAAVGGVQYTDLLVDGSPASSVTSSSGGIGELERGALPLFDGPDDDAVLTMWAQVEGATSRYLIGANNIGTYVNASRALLERLTAVVALTDAATIAVDASQGNHFRVTLGGNRTLGNPTGAVDGQKLLFELKQDGTGGRTITLDSKYDFGTDITSIDLTATAGKVDFLGVVYDEGADVFRVIAFTKGY